MEDEHRPAAVVVGAQVASDAVHGHGTSHGQFSKYRPSILHAMRTPPG